MPSTSKFPEKCKNVSVVQNFDIFAYHSASTFVRECLGSLKHFPTCSTEAYIYKVRRFENEKKNTDYKNLEN